MRGIGRAAAIVLVAGPGAVAAQPAKGKDDKIVVTADRQGSYGADFVEAGTFRDARLIDTPLTVSIMTRSLLEAQQARTVYDAVRNTAGVTQSALNTSIYSSLAIRGIAVNVFTNVRWNGVLPIVNLIEQPIEAVDRVEVLKGASGLYYGFAAPSGIVNLVSERPTAEPVTQARVLGDGNGSIGGSVDVGRRFGSVGVRVNAGADSLETGVRRTSGKRAFATAAGDWRIADGLALLVDAEYIDKTITEPSDISLTAVNGTITIPPLQSPRKNLGGKWMQAKGREHNLLGRLNWDFARHWRIALAIGQSYLSRDRAFPSFGGYDLRTGDGVLTVAQTTGNAYRSNVFRADLSGGLRTGPIRHQLSISVADQARDGYVPTAVRTIFAQNLYDPRPIPPLPAAPRVVPNPTETRDLGFSVADQASLGDWLHATLGYRKTDYRDLSLTSRYVIKPGTLSYGVLVKPARWASVYANYIEGLEPGPSSQLVARNAGEILPAAVSKQREAGVKVEPLRGLLLTGAYFRITRPSAYLNSANFFVQDGEALYEGGEIGASGEIGRNLSIVASAMVLDATQRSGAAATVGKRIENASRFSGSVSAEYRVPQVPGLRLTAAVFRVGRRAVNALNQAYVPGYETFDLGASYVFDAFGARTTIHLYAENVADRRYWAATGSSLLAPGLPRSVRFSVTTALP